MTDIKNNVDSFIINDIIKVISDKFIKEPLEKIKEITYMIFKISICLAIIVIIPLITLVIIMCYVLFLYLRRHFNSYDSLINILRNVNNNNAFFMNYGYWDKPNMNIEEANKKLCKLMFKKGDLNAVEHILDVGCGYGEQDFYWKKMGAKRITAIDISKKSIKHANKINFDKIKKRNRYKDLRFDNGNACQLNYKDNTFDRVTSLESAFHYDTRKQFLEEAYRVLKPGGKLVIADILYNDDNIDIFNVLNRKAFGKLFNIPEKNRITPEAFKNQLKKIGYKVKLKDITHKTFKPYYKYFIENVNHKDTGINKYVFYFLRKTFGFYINTLCGGTNGFKYVIAVCEKQ